MKLCQIVPSLEEKHGGPSKSIYELSAALARAGHEVELFATHPDEGSERTEGSLHLRIFRRDWPQRLCPSAGLRDAVRASNAEIFHHHSLWLRTLHYAHRTAVAHGAKLVLSPRGMMSTWSWRHHGWRKALARQLLHPGALSGADGWHATSGEEENDIRGRGFTRPICVAPNGVHAPDVTELARAAAYWHTACPQVGERPVALFYSRFHQKKRLIELIDLWLEQGPRDWLLLLVGIPQDYTAQMLESYVLRMSGAGRVRAFAGTGRPPPYAVARLFLLPSHSENFGLVIAEALANGLPAIVTDTTPWRGLNDDGRGWCVPWADFGRALTTAVSESPEKLRSRGARAKEWVLREFSWDRCAQQLGAFYQTLKEGRR